MYRYTECGLRNVWLVNGYREETTPYGRAVAIENVDGLHRAIGRTIVRRPGRMTGAEFRFLRKELELSQEVLARYLGSDVQALARWEKGRARVPGPADRFLRGLYREHADGNAEIRKLVERLAEADAPDAGRLEFSLKGRGWREAA